MAKSFAEWFGASYQREGEAREPAIARFQTEHGLGHHTVYYALRGSRVQPAVARRLEEITGGEVSASDLVLAPTRRELREEDAARNDPDPSSPEAA